MNSEDNVKGKNMGTKAQMFGVAFEALLEPAPMDDQLHNDVDASISEDANSEPDDFVE